MILTLTLIFSSSATAWDDTGHKVSTYIAWQQMTPEARAKAIALLTKAPEDSHISLFLLPSSRSRPARELDMFMIASTWSDMLRNRDYKVRFEKYNRAPWHYAGILWKQENGQPVRDPSEGDGLAVPTLYELEKQLRDTSLSDAEKAVSLAWFLHVAGDIHNPLHNASRISDLDPTGDSGGNRFLLVPEGTKENILNLHSYWDGILRRNLERKNDECDSDYIPDIARKVTGRYPLLRLQNRLKLSDYKEWNEEGYRLLNQVVYTPDLKRNEMPTKKYQRRAFESGQEQIALAGYRIAATLNQILR